MAIERSSSAMRPAQRWKSARLAGFWVLAGVSLSSLTACSRAQPKSADSDHYVAPEDPPKQAVVQRHTRIELPVPVEFHGIRTRDGAALSADELLAELSAADAVCVGEEHDNPRHHWAQYRILSELIERRQMNGRKLGLGLEMVSRKAQPALNRWSRGESKAPQALAELKWNETWGYDFGNYEPLWRLAQRYRVELVGLNLEQTLSKDLARRGMRGLTDEQRAELPQGMSFRDRDHRRYFDAAMEHHPPPKSSRERYYQVQVAWDETMADTAGRWLVKQQPASQLLILAGLGHCRDSAIPSRLERRASEVETVSVRPWVTGAEPTLPKLLEEGSFDYVLVMSAETAPKRGRRRIPPP